MEQLKWRIKNSKGSYVVIPKEEPGTVLLISEIGSSTVFGPCTKDYMDGYCAAMNACLDGGFVVVPAVSVIHPQILSNA